MAEGQVLVQVSLQATDGCVLVQAGVPILEPALWPFHKDIAQDTAVTLVMHRFRDETALVRRRTSRSRVRRVVLALLTISADVDFCESDVDLLERIPHQEQIVKMLLPGG